MMIKNTLDHDKNTLDRDTDQPPDRRLPATFPGLTVVRRSGDPGAALIPTFDRQSGYFYRNIGYFIANQGTRKSLKSLI